MSYRFKTTQQQGIQYQATDISIKLIILRRQDHLAQFLTDSRHSGQVYPVVINAQQLMNHSLICPLEGANTYLFAAMQTHYIII